MQNKYEYFNYFIECYFNWSMNYTDLKDLILSYIKIESYKAIQGLQKEINELYNLNEPKIIKLVTNGCLSIKPTDDTIHLLYNELHNRKKGKNTQKKGNVSLWLGNFKEEKAFQQFTSHSYTNDGNLIQSKFEESFHIDYYNEDFLEIDYKETKTNNLYDLLHGFSNDVKITSGFIKMYNGMPYNSILLLYNFEYNGSQKKYEDSNNQLDYINCITYKTT